MTATMRIEAPAALESLTERGFQSLVVPTAQHYGWLVTAFPQMVGNPPGWPDLTLLRGSEYRLLELKKRGGHLSARQVSWHEIAAYHGVPVHTIYPTQEDWERLLDLLV